MLRSTERDKKLIVKCGLCRWLTTTQIHRLYFPRATLNAVQKRLPKLTETGYLRTHRESVFSEALHAPGPKGRAILERNESCVPWGKRCFAAASPSGRGERHFVLPSKSATVPIAYFYAHWQLASLGWAHPVIPDAVFGVRRARSSEFCR